jgi:hypothetical protein
MTDTSHADLIKTLVDAAPPLTDDQKARLRALLAPEAGR